MGKSKSKRKCAGNNAGENGEQGSDCRPVCQDCIPNFSRLEAKLKALKKTNNYLRTTLKQVMLEKNKKIAEKDLLYEKLKQENMLKQNQVDPKEEESDKNENECLKIEIKQEEL